MTDKKTMTINLSAEEMTALVEICQRYEMSKTATVRRAIRMLLAIDARTRRGEKVFVEDELLAKKSELVVL